VFNPFSHELLVYGGRLMQPPLGLLADVHILSIPDTTQEQQQPQQSQQQQQKQPVVQQPVWRQVQPARVALQHTASSGPHPQHLQGMLPLAGHSGGVVGGSGEVAFVGGYRRNDIKEPQPLLQVRLRCLGLGVSQALHFLSPEAAEEAPLLRWPPHVHAIQVLCV
jgi:hypothetical protein